MGDSAAGAAATETFIMDGATAGWLVTYVHDVKVSDIDFPDDFGAKAKRAFALAHLLVQRGIAAEVLILEGL